MGQGEGGGEREGEGEGRRTGEGYKSAIRYQGHAHNRV